MSGFEIGSRNGIGDLLCIEASAPSGKVCKRLVVNERLVDIFPPRLLLSTPAEPEACLCQAP